MDPSVAYELSLIPSSGNGNAPAPLPKRRIFDLEWSRIGIALALLGGVSASLANLVATLTVVDRLPFYLKNQLDATRRSTLWQTMLIGVAVVVLPALVSILVTRGRVVPALIRLADWMCPLIIVGLLPSLFAYDIWTNQPLTFLLLLAATVLLTEQLMARWLAGFPELFRVSARRKSRPRLERWLPLAVVVVAALAYAVMFSYYTLLNHRRFGTAAFDLGINVNWCYNALTGSPWRCPVLYGPNGGNFLGNHAIFAMFLWLPFFALWPGGEMFLVYQAVLCGIGAIPLYLFAKELLPKSAAVIVAFAYLMFAPLHGPNFYDYHELLVALPFHFLLYYLIVKERYRWIPLVVIVIYMHREDMPVGVTILGAFLLLSGLRRKLGAALMLASIVVFIGVKFVLMPSMGTWWFADIYKELSPKGSSGYGPVVQTILVNPAYALGTLLREQKVIYFLHLFAPLVFLPLRRPLLVLLAIPGFFFTLMTTGYAPTLSISFQYTAHWIPYIFLASVLSLRLIRDSGGPTRQWAALLALVLGVAAHSTTFGAVVQHENFVGGFQRIVFRESDSDKKLYQGFMRLARMIPPKASVAATEREVPHVAARRDCYTLRGGHGDADYLLVRPGEATDILQDAFKRNRYGLIGRVEKTFYLFKKNHDSPDTATAKKELGVRD